MRVHVMLAGVLVVANALASQAQAQTPSLELTLAQAETDLLARSDQLAAKRAEVQASRSRESMLAGLLWPKLSLEASQRNSAVVPEFEMAPGRTLALSDHLTYSVGPQVSFNFWDSGGAYANWQAAYAGRRAKEQELAGLERLLRQRTRVAYFQTQLTLAQVTLTNNALGLSRAQYQDIMTQAKAGGASSIDALSSHQEVLSRQRMLRQAQTALVSALRDLVQLTRVGIELDLSAPVDEGLAQKLPEGMTVATVLLKLDPLTASRQTLQSAAQRPVDPGLPNVAASLALAEQANELAASASSGHWPKLLIAAKSSLDYPNGPTFEQIHQNQVSLTASWTLFEGGRIVNQVAEQEHAQQAWQAQARQNQMDAQVAWQKAHDQLAQLEFEQGLDEQAVQETDTLVRITQQAYRAGRVGILDLQTANLRALTAKIQAVSTQTQTLIQLALLDALSQPSKDAKP